MFVTGLLKDESSSDLVSLLANPKKAEDMLKKMKAENARLIKATKDLTEAKSVKAYCDEKKKEADVEIKRTKDAVAELDKEKANYKKSLSVTKTKLDKREEAVSKRETTVESVAARLKKLEEDLIKREELISKRESAAEGKFKQAEKVRKEYTDKIADLKQRMKGL